MQHAIRINFINRKPKRTLRRALRIALVVSMIAQLSGAFYSFNGIKAADQYVMYAVQDSGGSDSQLFTYNFGTNEGSGLGGGFDGYDIEAMDIHPSTGELFAIAGGGGSKDGNVYKVDKTNGALTLIGNSGTGGGNEIVSASFHPDGTLWAFQENVGLVKVNTGTGAAQLYWGVSGAGVDDNWEGLAWNLSGTMLYGADGSTLYAWNPSTETASKVCGDTFLPKPTEALEYRPDGVLIAGKHGGGLYAVNPDNCSVQGLNTQASYDDVETLTFDSIIEAKECKLEITKIGTPHEVAPGGAIVYEIIVKNVGDADCTGEGVGVVETYDANTAFAMSTPAPSSGNHYWNLDVVSPGEENRIDITMTVADDAQDGSIITNKACVWAYQQGDKNDPANWKCATVENIVRADTEPGVCNMEITKTAVQEEIQPGDEIDYAVNIKNTGTAVCTGGGVEIQEFYGQGTVFQNANPSPTHGDAVWVVGSVFPDEERTIHITVDSPLNAHDGDVITNKACVWAYQQGDKNDPANWKCATATTTVKEPPSGNGCRIEVTKNDSKDPVAPGETFSYAITVENTGNGVCTGGGVELTDTYDAMTEFIASTPAADSGNNQWNFGTLFPDDSRTVTIQVKMGDTAADGYLARNNACVWAFQNGPKDDQNSWVCDEETTLVKKLPPSTAELTIVKTVSDEDEPAGKSNTTMPDTAIEYQIVVENTGNSSAMDVVITDDYDEDHLTITDHDSAVDANGTLTWDIGVINPGQSVTKIVVAQVKSDTPDATKVVNTVKAESSNAGTVNDSAETHVFIAPPPGDGIDISLTKTVNSANVVLDSEVTFTITVTNSGPDLATGVVIQDTLPSELQYIADSASGAYEPTQGIWTVGNLAAGTSTSFMLTVLTKSTGTFTNTAEAIAYNEDDIDSEANNHNAQEDDQASATVAVKEKSTPGCSGNCGGGGRSNYPKIGIQKSVSKTVVNPGDTITYTLIVTAGGDDESVNVNVSDTLPDGLSYTDGSANPRMWSLGNMPYGTNKTVTYDVKVADNAVVGSYENIAKAVISNGIPPDDRAEARATVEIRGGGGGGGGSSPYPILAIQKAASVSFVNPGDQFSYTVTVQNTGTGVSVNTRVDDTLPQGIVFSDDGTATRIFDIGNVNPGETKQLYYTVRVAQEATAGIYTNFASVRADNAPSDSDTADVEVRLVTVQGFTELPNTGIEDGVAAAAGALAGVMVAIGAGVLLIKKREEESDWAV